MKKSIAPPADTDVSGRIAFNLAEAVAEVDLSAPRLVVSREDLTWFARAGAR